MTRHYSKPPIPPAGTIKSEDGRTSGPFLSEDTTCGCGRPAKYQSHDGVGSCNKYGRCPTYEELEQTNKELASDLEKALAAATSLSIYRDSTSSWDKALNVVNQLKEKNHLV